MKPLHPVAALSILIGLLLLLAACHEGGEGDPCEGVDCGGHGVCRAVDDVNAECRCDEGFRADGPTCVPDGADGDADGDVDGDVDSDTDSDADAETDAEPDGGADADADADVDPGAMCGNNVVEASEICDGSELGGVQCQDLEEYPGNRYEGGDLGCGADCSSFDESACWDCGDGFCDGEHGETDENCLADCS